MTKTKDTATPARPAQTELRDEELDRAIGGSGGGVSDGFELVYHKIELASGANLQLGDGSVRGVK